MAVVATALSLLAGGIVLSVAFDHNPQGEFIDAVSGAVQLDAAVPLFFLAAVPVAAIAFFAQILVYFAGRWFAGRMGRRRPDERRPDADDQ